MSAYAVLDRMYLQLTAQASEPAAASRWLLGCRGREATEAAPAGSQMSSDQAG